MNKPSSLRQRQMRASNYWQRAEEQHSQKAEKPVQPQPRRGSNSEGEYRARHEASSAFTRYGE